MQLDSLNFSYLNSYNKQLVSLGNFAERNFKDNPRNLLITLGQFAELLVKLTAAKAGLFNDEKVSTSQLIQELQANGVLNERVADLFSRLLHMGSQASCKDSATHMDALSALRIARALGIWFHRTFGPNKNFNPRPFVPPPAPDSTDDEVEAELEKLRSSLQTSLTPQEQRDLDGQQLTQKLLTVHEIAAQRSQETAILVELSKTIDDNQQAVNEYLRGTQASSGNASAGLNRLCDDAKKAALKIELDEGLVLWMTAQSVSASF
ncbi:MAG TPA: hypothetical protein V6C97_12420 [Oculatellaceae cyanobacterium]